MILALFICLNFFFHTCIFLLQLTKYIGFFQLIIIIAFTILSIYIILSNMAKLNIKSFWFF